MLVTMFRLDKKPYPYLSHCCHFECLVKAIFENITYFKKEAVLQVTLRDGLSLFKVVVCWF